MTKRQGRSGTIDVKVVLAEDEEFLRALVRTALQEVLEAEMAEALGAEKGERAAGRRASALYPCIYHRKARCNVAAQSKQERNRRQDIKDSSGHHRVPLRINIGNNWPCVMEKVMCHSESSTA